MTDNENMSQARPNRKLNGWQRLWLVGTVCLGLWLMGWWPLETAGDVSISNFSYRRDIEKDLRNPQCGAYQVAPISTLREPSVLEEGSCWHIYTSRKYEKTDEVPYTLEVYDRNARALSRNIYFQGLGLGAGLTIFFSAVVYFVAG
jgi:hypothetical protein